MLPPRGLLQETAEPGRLGSKEPGSSFLPGALDCASSGAWAGGWRAGGLLAGSHPEVRSLTAQDARHHSAMHPRLRGSQPHRRVHITLHASLSMLRATRGWGRAHPPRSLFSSLTSATPLGPCQVGHRRARQDDAGLRARVGANLLCWAEGTRETLSTDQLVVDCSVTGSLGEGGAPYMPSSLKAGRLPERQPHTPRPAAT